MLEIFLDVETWTWYHTVPEAGGVFNKVSISGAWWSSGGQPSHGYVLFLKYNFSGKMPSTVCVKDSANEANARSVVIVSKLCMLSLKHTLDPLCCTTNYTTVYKGLGSVQFV